jgi:death-on-curing protein
VIHHGARLPQRSQGIGLQQELIDLYGGEHGLRDPGHLKSALAMPQAMVGGQYLHADLFHMAAAYRFHIVQNHPFVDGNKRAGAAAAIVFLEINDVEIENDEDGLVELTLRVASGEGDKDVIARFFRKNAL